LKKIPFHSLDIEWKDGGLRLEESIRPLTRTEKFVNEFYSIESFKVKEIGPSIYSIPSHLSQTLPTSNLSYFDIENNDNGEEPPHKLSEFMRLAFKSKRKLRYDRFPVVQRRRTVFSTQNLKLLNTRFPKPSQVGLAKLGSYCPTLSVQKMVPHYASPYKGLTGVGARKRKISSLSLKDSREFNHCSKKYFENK